MPNKWQWRYGGSATRRHCHVIIIRREDRAQSGPRRRHRELFPPCRGQGWKWGHPCEDPKLSLTEETQPGGLLAYSQRTSDLGGRKWMGPPAVPQETLLIGGPKAGKAPSPQTLRPRGARTPWRKSHQKEGPECGTEREGLTPDSLPSLSCVTSSKTPHLSEPPSLNHGDHSYRITASALPAPQTGVRPTGTTDTLCEHSSTLS